MTSEAENQLKNAQFWPFSLPGLSIEQMIWKYDIGWFQSGMNSLLFYSLNSTKTFQNIEEAVVMGENHVHGIAFDNDTVLLYQWRLH